METSTAGTADQGAERVAIKVRKAISAAGKSAGMEEAVDAARAAMISADAVSLFGMETDPPEHGAARWLVGQSGGESTDYVVLALTPAAEGALHELHAASAADLSDALMQLAPHLAAPPEAIVAPTAEAETAPA